MKKVIRILVIQCLLIIAFLLLAMYVFGQGDQQKGTIKASANSDTAGDPGYPLFFKTEIHNND